MACPLCGDVCHCSYVSPDAISFSSPETGKADVLNPDAFEDSEPQFASSVRPSPSGIERAARESESEPWTLVSARVAEKVARVRAARSQPATSPGESWREEVAERLEKYRIRRGRPRPERTLRLNFDPPRAVDPPRAPLPVQAEPEPEPLEIPPLEPVVQQEVAAETILEDAAPEPVIVQPPQPRAPEPAKIIAFPRQPVVPPSADELAEPIVDRLRILEAPESVGADSPLADITLAPPADDGSQSLVAELSLRPAAMELRVFAGLIDGLLVVLASGIFVAIAAKLSAQAPQGKAGTALMVALPCVLWAIYEYVFLVHGGATFGMQMAHLGLTTFGGDAVPRALRRWRALAMILAGFSLGLGLLWALLDEDTLCWHDRITRTYPVRAPLPAEIPFP